MTTDRRNDYFFILLASALIVAISLGVRQAFGVFLRPVVIDLDLMRQSFGFAIALQNLVWGLAQPAAGILADRYGNFRVLAISGLLYSFGLVLTAFSASDTGLYLSAGMLVGLALAGSSFTVVLSAVARLVPEERRSMAMGITSAGGSAGMFIFVPISQLFIDSHGWFTAMLILAGCALFIPLLAGTYRKLPPATTTSHARQHSLTAMLKLAAGHRGYLLLNLGFMVCGFHVVFIATHLPAYISDQSLSPMTGAIALALIGFFNIIGTYTFGMLGDRYRKKYLLSHLYFARSIVIALFILTPVSDASVILFTSAIGLLWLGTVPLTGSLVAQIFGAQYMGTLFGIVFLSHQIGSFLGAWLGGYYYDLTGSYDQVWYMAVILGVMAALLHWPIDDRKIIPATA
ncbi:MAG: MFS transporter [Gammaproteobacteria bacterium]